MDKLDMQQLALKARSEAEAIRAADTPENEERVIALLATKGVKVTRLKLKKAQRYNMTLASGHIGPVTLLDLQRQCMKLGLMAG